MKFDAEVERVLLEIRQNLSAEIDSRAELAVAPNLQVLMQLESYLSVTERAWSQLPPVMSDRQGWQAHIEIWVKRQVKRATRWYVWEQINFNAATNEALRKATTALAHQQREQAALRAQLAELNAEVQSLRKINARGE
jgi:hypothetical protein